MSRCIFLCDTIKPIWPESWLYVAQGSDIWPRLSCFFYTKYRRSHARSIVFKRDRLVRNLDKNIGARMHAGSFADSSEILTKICQSSKLPVFTTQTRVGGVVVRSGSVINFELVYFPMIHKKAPQKAGPSPSKIKLFLKYI